jgi:DNA processing protein
MQALHDWLLVALTPGIGPAHHLGLIQHFGSISQALNAPLSELSPLLGEAAALALSSRVAAADCQAALSWAERPDAFLLTLNDQDYPLQLAQAPGAPPLLFGLGRRSLLQQPILAMVGSRGAFEPACATARDFADALAQHGYTIVSGMASGIDSAAHRGALNHPASSIAVIGTGIDRIYPAGNRALAQRLAQEGLILSEFALGEKPLAHHFPRRNRIIAGLARGCLVVEATIESGSLITARLAADAGREVMAIPGSIHNPQARGCHRLIKQGATLIETIEDILAQVGALTVSATPLGATKTAFPSSMIIQAMSFEPVTIDTLGTTLGLTAAELYAMLLQLELEGRVASLPGGRFQRLQS